MESLARTARDAAISCLKRRPWLVSVAKVTLDGAVTALALYLALDFRFDGAIPAPYLAVYWSAVASLVVSRVGAIAITTRYRQQWHTTSLVDLHSLGRAVIVGSVAFALIHKTTADPPLPRSVMVLEAFLVLNFLVAMRLLTRMVWKKANWFRACERGASERRRVLVIGAGDAGQRIVRSMQEDAEAGLVPVGFVDDDPSRSRRIIHGVPILGTLDDITRLSERHCVDQILIALPSLSGSAVSEIVRRCSDARADITMLPSLPEMLGSNGSTRQIRKVRVEDLLERSPVHVDIETIASYTTGETIMVTGAGGSIGSELCRQVVALEPRSVILVGKGENSIFWIEHELRTAYGYRATCVIADVRDRAKMEQVFRQYRPGVVFHAAAHKHVPLMEANPEEAVKNNVFGTRNLAELSIAHGVRRFVMVSTDKAVNPTSVMGASKRLSEMVVQSLAQRIADAGRGRTIRERWGFNGTDPGQSVTRFTSVRFGNVLGSRGSLIPILREQIERGGPVTVTDPQMVRFFMTIPEAVQLVIQAGGMGMGGEVFVLDMGEPVRILDLARNYIRLCGFVPDKDIKVMFTGVRPGEKLYEEVLTAEEGTVVTNHQKIHVARAAAIDHEGLETALEMLGRAVQAIDRNAIRSILKSVIPTYQPVETPDGAGSRDAHARLTLSRHRLQKRPDGRDLTDLGVSAN